MNVNKFAIGGAATLVLILAVTLHFRAQGEEVKAATKPAASVRVANVVQQDVPIIFTASGNVVSLNSVDLRPQVTGVVRALHFREGDFVKAGQVLFELDDAAERAALDKARAQLAKDKIQLAVAQRDLARNQSLVEKHFISPSAIDSSQGNVDGLQSTLVLDQAGIAQAETDLGYKTLRSPITGRLGVLNVHPGSLVQPTMATPLVTVTQLDPIQVTFTLPERNLAQVFAAQQAKTLTVTARLANQSGVDGKLVFIDNSVDPQSGTIRMKAEFGNREQHLWPGSYANVTVTAGVQKDALLVPASAVLAGPAGRFAFVVDQNKVKSVPVKVLNVASERAIVTGLAAGQRVVSDGGGNLRDGDAVAIIPDSKT